jgi:hypothetical protein
MILELWGQNFSSQRCGPAKEPYPRELCGVRVLVGPSPAELLYVSSYQINLKIPADVPPEGIVPFQVCAGALCSDLVEMRFSARTAVLSLERPAYVRMPVWIHIETPAPYLISYPCRIWPWDFRGYEFEVQRDGRSLLPIPQPPEPKWLSSVDSCIAPSARSTLPLHLLYRFDEPGDYSVRFTARKGTEIQYQSDWTTIHVEPYSPERRDESLRSAAEAMTKNDRQSVYDLVPSLLAWPDEKALAILLKLFPPDVTQCTNFDCIRQGFGRAALAAFPDALLRREIPPERLAALCPPGGNCR